MTDYKPNIRLTALPPSDKRRPFDWLKLAVWVAGIVLVGLVWFKFLQYLIRPLAE